MAEKLIDVIRDFLKTAQGHEVSLSYLRMELRIDPTSPAWGGLRKVMERLSEGEQRLVKPTGRNDGTFKVITQVQPVKVFGRDRKPPITIKFPKDWGSKDEFPFAENVILREGDMIIIGGVTNLGKTTLCMNFCGENIDAHPVLMGNEYTTIDHEPNPRFLSRIDNMDWVSWANEDGEDKFTLLPVRDDYAEHIIKDRINIIDWINLDGNQLYSVNKIMDDIKRELGKGIGIISLQKKEGAEAARGGQFSKDFADLELLIDKYGEDEDGEILMKVGKVKECKGRVSGRAFAYRILDGVKIMNFRELIRCPQCKGYKVIRGQPCGYCSGRGRVDKDWKPEGNIDD